MMSRIFRLGLGAVLALAAGTAWADGIFIAPPGSFMYEPAQQAFIAWDSETGNEALTILPAFSGAAEEFAWIVPVPGLPELAAGNRQLFYDLDDITRPVYRSRDGQWDCGEHYSYDVVAPGADNGVDVIGSETVGYYQTMILSATNAPALLDSLTAWGFLHEENGEAVAAAIGDYVERSWFFVTLRVDPEDLDEYYNGDYYYYPYYYGGLEPITLTFAADAPVYPMKISAYSAAASTSVNVFIKADRRLTFPGADTYYANRFTAGELADLPYLPGLSPLLREGDFLTKLHRGYTPAQMTEDIYFTPADDGSEFRLISYSGWPVTTLLLLGPPAFWGVRRRFRPR